MTFRSPLCLTGILSALLLIAILAGCKPKAEVAQFRADSAHSGVYSTNPIDSLQGLAWSYHTGGIIYSSPAVSEDLVFIGSGDSCLYAVGKVDGAIKWRFKTGGPVHSSPAVFDRTVYFGSADGLFYAVDAGTGTEKWHFQTGGERRFSAPGLHGLQPKTQIIVDDWDVYLSSPAVSDNLVVFGSGDGNVYALDAATGTERWRFSTGGIVHASPAVSHQTVYIGSWDTNFYALDIQTGKEKWRFKTGVDTMYYNQTGIQSSAAVDDSTVYFGCRDANLYALNAFTGKLKWKFYADMSWIITSPAVADGKIYFGTSDSHRFLVLDAKTGKVLTDLNTDMYLFSSPSVAGSSVYVGTFGGKLLAIDRNRPEIRWEYVTEAAREDRMDVLSDEGTLNAGVFTSASYQDAPASYARIISVGSILSSPVVDEGTVYFGSTDGNLYAVH